MSHPPGISSAPSHPGTEHMGRAVQALATGVGSIQARLQAAAPHFALMWDTQAQSNAERHLRLRIAAGLVEGGEDAENDEPATKAEIAESIALLSEERASQIALDMFRLYEVLAGVRLRDGVR